MERDERHRQGWTALVLLAALVGLFVWLTGGVLLVIFAGLLLAVGLDGIARALADWTRLPRGLLLLLVLAGLFGLIGVFFFFVVPQFVAQLGELQQNVEDFLAYLRAWFGRIGVTEGVLEDAVAEGQAQLGEAAGTIAAQVATFGLTTLGVLSSLVVMLAIAAFTAYDPDLYRRGLLRLVPPAQRPLAADTLGALGHALRWWFLSQLASMAILGVTVGVGLWVIGIELWLSLAILTALLTFIPYLGPVIAAVPVLIVGFAAGVETGLIVTGFYFLVQNIEGAIIVPLLQQKAVRLAPAVGISAQVFLGVVFGIAGFILAAPLAVVGQVLVQKLYVQGVLGERV